MNKTVLFLTAAFFLSPTAWAVNYIVTDPGDSGQGTLRDAVKKANLTLGKDIITFHAGPILSDSVNSINITDPVIIDGESNYTISAVNTTVSGLALRKNSDGSEIRNIAFINLNTAVSIGSSDNHIYGCRIGTGWINQTGVGNNTGININGGNNNLIGGIEVSQRNIISGNNYGIRFDMMDTTTGNRVMNNYIGVNSAGTEAMSNSTGISAWGQNVIIGGNRLANEGNLICGGGIVVGGSGNTIMWQCARLERGSNCCPIHSYRNQRSGWT